MAKKIRGWDDLDGLENEHFKVKFFRERGNGDIVAKTGWAKDKYPYGYLSTHTFYPEAYKGAEEMLKERGFDVELVHDMSDEYIPYKSGGADFEG